MFSLPLLRAARIIQTNSQNLCALQCCSILSYPRITCPLKKIQNATQDQTPYERLATYAHISHKIKWREQPKNRRYCVSNVTRWQHKDPDSDTEAAWRAFIITCTTITNPCFWTTDGFMLLVSAPMYENFSASTRLLHI